MPKFPTATEAIELSGEKLPITLGHECVISLLNFILLKTDILVLEYPELLLS